ncbi:UDP-2,3-diacylglucosamine diphosphatase [Sulfurospirillum halorespirans]|uniref:UDP-2,3-diacylglucosamine hydrolase n=1 Tax=Sulfurospirillum halorespirans DSM 13726 TaxID=1193502 RepID=A0A1D7TGA3_9BACT|nr:UDP-2,3-diacylglucosamine diphosphatase [Sulfurospirillum halorespirans]AOO64042.1 UDP-2,3-diacylglucosamine hydrolase [Sulfurospirillum halorespirans DSM 13726]
MSPNLIIQEGALFIADAHDSSDRSFFFDFLLHVKQNPPPQLFLMGDMFDLLVGSVAHGVQQYQRYIDLIEELGKSCEVYYFEGNHDFDLSKLFNHVKVIPIEEQPLTCKLPSGKTCLLLHGDKYGTLLNRTYTKIIRNQSVLKILNYIDKRTDASISKKIQNDQHTKKLCKTIEHFATQIQRKLHFYPKTDVIAEGHYHQNVDFMVSGVHYVNFSSFACNQSYFSVQSSSETEFAQKQLRGCNG